MTKKKQHIIPQFYLRNFSCEDSKEHIWTYDSENGKNRRTLIKETAHENYYFGVRKEDGTYDNELEDVIASFESKAAPILERFIEGEDILGQNKADLASFFALMVVRTNTFRRQFAEMKMINVQTQMYANAMHDDTFEKYIKKYETDTQKILSEKEKADLRGFSLNPDNMEIIYPRDLTIEAIRFHDDLVPIFYDMRWSLISVKDSDCFLITSDNPVVRFVTDKSYTIYGGGFADPRIEVTLPLSTKHCWFGHWNKFYDKSIVLPKPAIKQLNKQRAINSERYLFCHRDDEGIRKLAKKYNVTKPTITASGFGPKKYLPVKVKRV